jgi:hypothetical protein
VRAAARRQVGPDRDPLSRALSFASDVGAPPGERHRLATHSRKRAHFPMPQIVE